MKMTLEDWQLRGFQSGVFSVFPKKTTNVVLIERSKTFYLEIDGHTEHWASLQGIALRLGKTRPSLVIGEAQDKEDSR